jgi:U2-associated protein SR140
MVFALDNADAAGDVVEVLAESLTLSETPPPTKLARLFLVNDILHNSTAPVRNASRYRAKLEGVLPEVFESFQVRVWCVG